MAKQWFYQIMGEELGPISSAELRNKAERGEVTPDTSIRMGADGPWQIAARVKGLFPEPPPPPPPSPKKTVDKAEATASAVSKDTEETATYHLTGVEEEAPADSAEKGDGDDSHAPHSDSFEFFEFVGFEQAIGHRLYAALMQYVREHDLTITQATRTALAQLVGRPELADEEDESAEGAATQEAPSEEAAPEEATSADDATADATAAAETDNVSD